MTGTAAAASPLDTSDSAVERFQAEWYWEVMTPTDAATPLPKLVNAGSAACNTLARNPDRDPAAVADLVTSTFGFAPTGGQAVTAAALRTLCPTLDRGYQTYWDGKVKTAQDELARLSGIVPNFGSTNRTLRVGCVPFNRSSTPLVATVEANLTATGTWPVDDSGHRPPFESVFQTLQHQCAGAPPVYPTNS